MGNKTRQWHIDNTYRSLIEERDNWRWQFDAAAEIIAELRANLAAERAEIERLRAAIDAVRQAVTDAGSHPEHHHEVRRRHEQEWPTLWRAIAGLREARRD